MTDKRLRAAVILSNMVCPFLDRLPPLQWKAKTDEESRCGGKRWPTYIDDAKIQLKPSTIIILTPHKDAG
jgi:hypothetical protein